MPGQPTSTRYLEPDTLTRHVLNPLMAFSTRIGLSIHGSRVLRVRGRTSGEWRTTPVNPLVVESDRYLVAPRGVTQWVRNLRAAGGGELALGRRVEPFTAEEVADSEKPELLRAYLTKWKFEVGQFFDGVGPDAPVSELLGIAPGYPVFRITTAPDPA